VIAIPIIYFSLQRIVYEEVDEGLVAQKEEIKTSFKNIDRDVSIPASVAAGFQLTPSSSLAGKDSFFNVEVFDKISRENIPYRVLKSDLVIGGKTYTFQLKRSLIDNEDLIQSIAFAMTILLILTVVGLLAINRIISKKIWRPFYNTVKQLNDYHLEKKDVPQFETSKIDEFRDLNNSITSLINRNISVFQSQKEFTENAAHEMQTPLAVLQGKIELLMQTQPLNAEQADLISGLADANQRMNKLNKSLLLLTKIENNQFEEKEKINLVQTLEKIVGQFEFVTDKKNIVFNETEEQVTIQANRTLIEILVGNLLSNAMRHNPEDGKIVINMKNSSGLTISNTAKNGPLDQSKIFERFQKNSEESNSTGLGLAIASKICTLYNYDLSYEYSGKMHTFSVQF
jgi:signal transduction histidine kinase